MAKKLKTVKRNLSLKKASKNRLKFALKRDIKQFKAKLKHEDVSYERHSHKTAIKSFKHRYKVEKREHKTDIRELKSDITKHTNRVGGFRGAVGKSSGRFSSAVKGGAKSGVKGEFNKIDPFRKGVDKDNVSDSGVEGIRLTRRTVSQSKNLIRTGTRSLKTTKRTVKRVTKAAKNTVRFAVNTTRFTVKAMVTAVRIAVQTATHVTAMALNPITWLAAILLIIFINTSSLIIIILGGGGGASFGYIGCEKCDEYICSTCKHCIDCTEEKCETHADCISCYVKFRCAECDLAESEKKRNSEGES